MNQTRHISGSIPACVKNIREPISRHWPFFLRLMVLLSSVPLGALADPWCFIVTGDGRTDTRSATPDPTGINTQVFTNLLHSINQRKLRPRFVLFTGDLVCGSNKAVKDDLADQFSAWKELVKTQAPGLSILPVRGNHETYGDAEGKQWQAAFRAELDAQKVAYFPGEEGFSYVYSAPDHPEVAVIALDQFIRPHRVNLLELENALERARASHAAHVFVFAHEMAFTCASHRDAENMAAFPDDRDKFVNLLQAAGCEYFFAGHDHTYDWMSISHKSWPAKSVLNQIVAGTAGAPFYEDQTYYGDHHGYKLLRLDHHQNTNGYLVVTIDDGLATNRVKVTFEPVAIAP